MVIERAKRLVEHGRDVKMCIRDRFDPRYQNHSDNAAMKLVAEVFKVPESSIKDIRCLKAGMTNKSFLFKVCLLYTSRCV